MATIQNKKGMSLERLLNDPMAMFGALGVCGALVVVVWVVAGSSGPKDDEASTGSFVAAPSATAHAKVVVPAGSSLGVAKFKAGARGATSAEVLKDAGGSASIGGHGILRGTMAEIEAGQKADAAKESSAGAETAVAKKAIPVESDSGAHVPGMVPDSTQLAAAGKGSFGPTANLNNSGYSAGSGASATAGAPGTAASASAGATPPVLGEGGPLASVSVPGRTTVVGARPFQRGQTAGGSGAAAGAASGPLRASGGLGAGGGGGAAPSLAGGAGRDFGGTTGAASSSGGSASASGSGDYNERAVSVGGGGPKAAGLGGLSGGRGSELSSGGGSSSPAAARQTSVAKKTELKDQAKKHLDEANTYRESVVMPLAKREKGHSAVLAAKLGAASLILVALDHQLGVEQAFFRNAPAATKALADSRALISQGPDSLKARTASAKDDVLAGADIILSVPQGCNFKPIIQVSVFRPWIRGNHPGYDGKGIRVVEGQRGYFVLEDRVLDLHGVATRGQDLLEGAARRASNVRAQAEAGVTMVGPEFDPAVEALAADPSAAQRLSSVAGRIKDDLGRVAALLPERVIETTGEASRTQGTLQAATRDGYSRISTLADKVGERRLGYPDGPERDALDRNMADARRNSTEALSSVNSLSGTSSDTMFVLTGASRSSTYALVDLCYSHDRLNEMVAKAKD